MIYHDRLKWIHKSCATEDGSYTLAGFYVDAEKKVAVATDGHALVALDVFDLLEPEEKSFVVPIEAAKAAQAFFAKQKRLKIPKRVFVRCDGETVAVSQEGSRRAQFFDKPRGQFPQWTAVATPPKDYKHAITISAGLLHRLSEAMHGDYSREDGVTLYVKDATSAIFVGVSSLLGLKTLGVLMPMRNQCAMPTEFWKAEKEPAA